VSAHTQMSPLVSQQRSEIIQNFPLFLGIPLEDRRTIVTRAQGKQLNRGKNVFFQGDHVEHVFLLTSGCVKFIQTGEDGKEVILRIAGQGEVLNAGSCMKCFSQCSTAQALESSTALTWEVKAFEALMEQFPALRNNVWRDFHKVVNQLEERYREICTRKVASRISSELVRLAPNAKKQLNEHRLALSQRDLAQLTGTTLFTVNRVLNQWELDGIVKTQRNTVVLQDVPALVKLSQMDED